MSKITVAVAWAVAIANDNTHGYDQINRWGADYDCSSLVISAWEQSGVPVKTKGAVNTDNMCAVFLNNGFKDVTSSVNLSTGNGLKTGDVLWCDGHTEMMCSGTQLVGATIAENGSAYADTVGDQTGNEIRIRDYYNRPWTKVLRYVENTISEDDVITGNKYLSLEEMQINAKFIYSYLHNEGWTLNAISGTLGNMQRESTINPTLWESFDVGNLSVGFGLVQWTPSTNLINWCQSNNLDYNSITSQLKRILYELDNGLQYYATDSYPETFREFTQSTKSPEYLAMAFLKNYERAGVEASEERQENARYWYDYLSGYTPDTPVTPDTPTTPTKRKSMSLIMMYIASKGLI